MKKVIPNPIQTSVFQKVKTKNIFWMEVARERKFSVNERKFCQLTEKLLVKLEKLLVKTKGYTNR